MIPAQHDEGSNKTERHVAAKKVGLGESAMGDHVWTDRAPETHGSFHMVAIEGVCTPMEQLDGEHHARKH